MRPIEGSITPEIESFVGDQRIAAANAFPVRTYRLLVEHVAKLAYLNKDYLLFFRGQSTDYRNKAGTSSFYPSIYRGDYVARREIRHRFDVLQGSSRLLAEEYQARNLPGAQELKRKKYIQWSILQHYEVCSTPLIDFSHSLDVACSFAVDGNNSNQGFVSVFGLPYITNRISINSEHDLVNIRLLSICPPNALRPYFQDGYLAGTEDVSDDYDNKSELDFNNRLIAKFRIRNTASFWGKHFSPIPHEALYPRKDEVEKLCKVIKEDADRELQSGTMGDFLKAWAELEDYLLRITKKDRKGASVRYAMRTLVSTDRIESELSSEFDRTRRFRNELVHKPQNVNSEDAGRYLESVSRILRDLKDRS